MNPLVAPLVLALLAALLSGPVPRALLRLPVLRRAPRAATVLWQSVALAAVVSALGAGLSLALQPAEHRGPTGYAVPLAVSALAGLVLARLLLSGHRVGTSTRAARRRHRELVDLLADRDGAGSGYAGVHVLSSPAPAAYCLPGLVRSRVVVSEGTFGRLGPEEVAAVLVHERAHLRARHDLVLEAFTVLHRAFPWFGSVREALAEVCLLVEVIADQAARKAHGSRAVARALVELADSRAPESALAAGGNGLAARVGLLVDERPHRLLSAVILLAAVAVVALPSAFIVAPLLR